MDKEKIQVLDDDALENVGGAYSIPDDLFPGQRDDPIDVEIHTTWEVLPTIDPTPSVRDKLV